MKPTYYEIDGEQIEFWPSSIIKDFWFPEDARSIEEWDAVQSKVQRCSQSEEFFIGENLSPRNCKAARILNALNDSKLNLWTVPGEPFIDITNHYAGPSFPDAKPLTAEGAHDLEDACNAEIAKFTKRLRTYLKRYGLSKCHFSSFWENA